MKTPRDYAQDARDALNRGDIAEANRLVELGKAAKAMMDLDTMTTIGQRLPYPDGTAAKTKQASEREIQDIAIKTWYQKRFGESSAASEQVAKELYGDTLPRVSHAKHVDFVRFIKTGQHQYGKMLLFSANQIEDMLATGSSVGEMKATQVESQDTLGGYLVPEDIREQIVERLAGMTVMRRMGNVMTTTRDRVTIPVQTGGDDRFRGATRAAWVDETPTAGQSETNATFGNITVNVHTLMASTNISKNILEDSVGALNIVTILTRNFSEDFGFYEDEAFLIGNGVAKPLGILKDATTGGPNAYSYGSVSVQNSGNGTALTADAFRSMPYTVPVQYRQAGGFWVMSRGTLRTIKQFKESGSAGAYLWADRIQQLQNGQPPRLEGYEIMETEVLASPTSGTTYTANVHPVMFVTPGAYQIVERTGMDIVRYDDSTTGKTNSIALVARRRVGGQLIRPWGVAVMKVSA